MTNEYFATLPPEELCAEVFKRVDTFYNETQTSGLRAKWRKSWRYYYNRYFTDAIGGFAGGTNDITFGGDEGELALLSLNNYRSLLQHLLVMTTSTRPAASVRASNSDSKSMVQARLGDGILDYYMREKRLEEILHKATEHALVLGSGYVRIDWDVNSGQPYGVDDMGNQKMEGDLKYSNPSVYDLVFDTSKESWLDNNWIIQITWANKYDLIAQYPEYADTIAEQPTKSDITKSLKAQQVDSEDIMVAEFFHKKSAALPNGRYMKCVSTELFLLDSELPFREIPIYRIVPADIMGTQFGYTPAFDMSGPQEALNMVVSAELSNINAFGVQNIAVPKGSDITVQSLIGGLNIVEYEASLGEPKPLQLMASNPAMAAFADSMNKWMENFSGINEVARGQAPGADMSAAAMSLLQSMAVQFNSGLQNSYARLIEDVGTGSLRILRDYASTKRVAAIAGIGNSTVLKEFSGDDLDSINRVVVDVGNPVMRTTAGKADMAEKLLNTGLIKTPEEYINVITTGQLSPLTKGVQGQNELVEKENEALLQGNMPVRALVIDNHAFHVRKHAEVLASPDARLDQGLTMRVLQHIQEHIVLMEQGDPALASVLGYQSLQQPPPPPGAQQAPEDKQPGQDGPPPGKNGTQNKAS